MEGTAKTQPQKSLPLWLFSSYLKISDKEGYDFKTQTIIIKIDDTMKSNIMITNFFLKINQWHISC